jgi:hypothetical protein
MLGKAVQHGLALDPLVAEALPITPDHRSRLHNSSRGLFWILPRRRRNVGVAVTKDGVAGPGAPLDPRQSLHESVLRRWDEDPGYRPRALRDYFRRANDARASG